jgi:hypothetical protein
MKGECSDFYHFLQPSACWLHQSRLVQGDVYCTEIYLSVLSALPLQALMFMGADDIRVQHVRWAR